MKKVLLAITFLMLLASCSFNNDEQDSYTMQDLQIPENFEFSMEKDVQLLIELENKIGNPIQDVVYNVYYINSEGDHRYISKTKTNAVGKINANLQVPAYVEKLFISGFLGTAELDIIDGEASYFFSPAGNLREGDFTAPAATRSFSYVPGITYNPMGVPSPREDTVIEPELLARIGTTLPESYHLFNNHPEYFNGTQPEFQFIDDSEVWVTFVSEGASFHNALGFYTYDTATGPPADPSSLDLTIVFPNCSFVNSGGEMESGMKVYLGEVTAGTTMGWFLVKDGWETGSTVSETAQRYYTHRDYNPEAALFNQHSVLLKDLDFETFMLGFEDKPRPYPSDNDFNDAVFLVDAVPFENVNVTEIPHIEIPPDTDEDGVSDPLDDYPEDPERAFDNYYPSEEEYATLVYEDLWPDYGDYDMNDMVMDYQYHYITNASGLMKDINTNLRLRAIGASFDNGFAIELPFEQSNMTLNGNSMNLMVSILDKDPALVDIFGATTYLTMSTTQIIYNTLPDDIYREPIEMFVNIELVSPVDMNTLAYSFPYNPFIYQQGNFDHEIHLMNMAPTDRHNSALFGTGDDASVPGNDQYYLSATNLPWALNMPETWHYPAEKNSIVDTYTHFAEWAESGGTLYPDWFLFNEENVNMEKVYITP